MTAQPAVRPLVVLAKTWGNQSRNNCPTCQRFLASGPHVVCRVCGISYRQVDGERYEAEAL